MIQKLNREQRLQVSSLFKDWNSTMICSCLEGEMGDVYAAEKMSSAKLDIGDFCFFGGRAEESLLYHRKKEYEGKLKILVPLSTEWEHLIEKVYGDGAVSYKRYSFRVKEGGFSKEKLCRIVKDLNQEKAGGLSSRAEEGFSQEEKRDFVLSDIDGCRDMLEEVSRTSWAGDWVSQFHGYEDYRKRGIGTALKYRGELVAGASSYTVSSRGIEIQIDTREDFRGQGLGKICGAALILRCLEQGRYPSWDADNEISAHLACSLGYEMDRVYTVYKTVTA